MQVSFSSLASSLNSVGISHAKGVDLPATRDQLNATLPRSEERSGNTTQQAAQKTAEKTDEKASTQATARTQTATRQLSTEEQRAVAQLQQIDRNVRAHEAAHVAAGYGVVTSGASFTYTYGPDGKQYATGGEVGIDTAAEKKLEANIDKGQRIQAAALAPRDPSSQDYRVASIGAQLEGQGRSDLARQQAEERAAAAAGPRIDEFA